MKRRTALKTVGASIAAVSGCSSLTPGGNDSVELSAKAPQIDRNVPMHRYDAGNTAHLSGGTGATVSDAYWYVDGEHTMAPSMPTLVDGVLYYAAARSLIARKATTGETLWRKTIRGRVRTTPAVIDGRVLIAVKDGPVEERGLHAFDAESGEPLWQVTPRRKIVSSPTAVDGTVYVGGSRESPYVYAHDVETGEEQWRFEVGENTAAPAVGENRVVSASTDPKRVSGLAVSNGDEVWSVSLDTGPTAPVLANGVVFVAYGETVLALDVVDGTEQWRQSPGGFVYDVAATEQGLYVEYETGEGKSGVARFDTADGRLRWDRDGPGVTAVVDGILYSSETSTLVAYDASDGSELFRRTFPEQSLEDGGTLFGTPMTPLVVAGVCYVTTVAGDVYALGNETAGPAES